MCYSKFSFRYREFYAFNINKNNSDLTHSHSLSLSRPLLLISQEQYVLDDVMGYSLWLHGFSFTDTSTHSHRIRLTSLSHDLAEGNAWDFELNSRNTWFVLLECCSATIYLIWRMCGGISPNTKSNLNCFVPVERRRTRDERQIHIHTYSS